MNNKQSEQKGVRYEDLNLPDFDLSFITPEYLGERKQGLYAVDEQTNTKICLLHIESCDCISKLKSREYTSFLSSNDNAKNPFSANPFGKFMDINLLPHLTHSQSEISVRSLVSSLIQKNSIVFCVDVLAELTFNKQTQRFEISNKEIINVLKYDGLMLTGFQRSFNETSSGLDSTLEQCLSFLTHQKRYSNRYFRKVYTPLCPLKGFNFKGWPEKQVFFSLKNPQFDFLSNTKMSIHTLLSYNWRNPIIETAIKKGYVKALDKRVRDPKNLIEAINITGISTNNLAKKFIDSELYLKPRWFRFKEPYKRFFLMDTDPNRKFDDDWIQQYNDYWNIERIKSDPKKNEILESLKDRKVVRIKSYKDSEKEELTEFGRRMANCLTTYFEKRHRVYEVTLEKGVTVAIDYDVQEDKFREVKLWNNLALPTNFKKWIKKEFRKWVGVETNP